MRVREGLGKFRAVGIFRVWMSKPSANSCRLQYNLKRATIFRADSFSLFFSPSFGNAYARYFAIGKDSVCAVCLSICPSIRLSQVMENKEKIDI